MFRGRSLLAILTLFALGTAALIGPAGAVASPPDTPPISRPIAGGGPGGKTAPGRIIVQLKAGATAADLAGLLATDGAVVDRTAAHGKLARVALPANASTNALLARLRNHPAVAAAGLDLAVAAFETPNDPSFPRQWHLQDTTGGMWAEGAWDLSPARGAGIIVAVIDTGVAYEDHSGTGIFGPKTFRRAPDLAGVTFVSPWDFVEDDAHANDEHGHGTHVTGTIAQATNNSVGGAGVSDAAIMPLRVLDFSGNGYGSDLVDAIYYAADHGARVINMSLGFSGTGSPDANGEVCSEVVGLKDALEYANAMGVTVVAASGNDGAGTVACPAAYPTVLAVGATRLDGAVTYYSNQGSALDLSAPGGDPNVDQDSDGFADQVLQESYCLDFVSLFLTGQFTQFCQVLQSGTSMASPHVAGTAALLVGQHSTLSPAQVREVLQTTARDRGAAGWDPAYGAGVVDARAAIASVIANPPPPPPPGPPPVPRPEPQPGAANLVATPLNTTSIRLNWTDQATAETGFRIDRSTDGGATWVQAAIVGANAPTWTNYSLAPATQYGYRVRSYDAASNSPWSDTVNVATLPPPSAPTGLTVTPLNTTTIRLNWVDTSSNEQGFKVERSLDGGATWAQASIVLANTTTWTNYSLTPGTTYAYRVRGYDGLINGDASEMVSGATLAPPSAPTGLAATPLNTTSIRLNWVDTSANEQGFKIERSVDGGATWVQAGTVLANTTTWTNYSLAAGTAYSYRVRGYEGLTSGDASAGVTASTVAAPAAPTGLTATGISSTAIRLNWVDNATNEQGFKIESSTDGVNWAQVGVAVANATTWTHNLLAPGTTRSYRVRGYEGVTNGEYSGTASASTSGAPLPPTGVTATGLTTTSVRLNWTNASAAQSGVKIERSLDGTTWTQVALLPATYVTWTNYSLAPGTTYLYRIRAYEGTTNGEYGDAVQGATLAPPAAPASVTATLLSATSVKLTWVDTCGYEAGFKVERSVDGMTWTQVAIVGANATTWTNYGVTAGTTYRYRVRAYESVTNGEWSAEVVIAVP